MYVKKPKETWGIINWKEVAKDYGGIEISPHLPKVIGDIDYLWYWTFDVASGCIWNIESIIKDTEMVYEKKKGVYVEV